MTRCKAHWKLFVFSIGGCCDSSYTHISSVGVNKLELEKKMNHPSMNLIRYNLNLYAR